MGVGTDLAESSKRRPDRENDRWLRYLDQLQQNQDPAATKVVIVGGGSAGLTVGHQLLRSGRFARDDIALIDPAEWYDYQLGWTLVGGGLKTKDQLRKPLASLINPKIYHYNDKVQSFRPDQNTISLRNGERVSYDQLVVCPGIRVDFGSIKGLAEAVHDPHSPVSSIYSYETCDKVARDIANFKKGRAVFTHPAGVVNYRNSGMTVRASEVTKYPAKGLPPHGDMIRS
ncbi:hypothetical protein FOMA001_g13682 [Fusarium oxysporum f. sp. matthiolae]|nr:hypothetical protein FOMA001_g13682 [Fusarium oxysporum f. sp. matthiolae]